MDKTVRFFKGKRIALSLNKLHTAGRIANMLPRESFALGILKEDWDW